MNNGTKKEIDLGEGLKQTASDFFVSVGRMFISGHFRPFRLEAKKVGKNYLFFVPIYFFAHLLLIPDRLFIFLHKVSSLCIIKEIFVSFLPDLHFTRYIFYPLISSWINTEKGNTKIV